MKTKAILLATMVLVAPMMLAQSVHIGAHGNFTLSNIPSPVVVGASAVSDAYGLGIGGGAHLDVNLLAFSFRLTADYIHYSVDADRYRERFRPTLGAGADLINVEGGGLGIYSVGINGKMDLLPIPVITPYLTAGIGLAWLNMDDIKFSNAGIPGNTVKGTSTNGKTMLNIGLGVDLKIGIRLYGEVKYGVIFTEGERSSYVPITIGITF